MFVRAAEFWSAYLLSSFAIKKEEREREIERKARVFFLWIKLLCAVRFSLSVCHRLSPPCVFLFFKDVVVDKKLVVVVVK